MAKVERCFDIITHPTGVPPTCYHLLLSTNVPNPRRDFLSLHYFLDFLFHFVARTITLFLHGLGAAKDVIIQKAGMAADAAHDRLEVHGAHFRGLAVHAVEELVSFRWLDGE